MSSSSSKMTTSKNSEDLLLEEAQYNATIALMGRNKNTILNEAMDVFPEVLLKALKEAMRQMDKRQKRALLLAAINIIPEELLGAVVNTDDGEEWIEKLIHSRFRLDMHKQISHEIGVLEGTIKAPKETIAKKPVVAATPTRSTTARPVKKDESEEEEGQEDDESDGDDETESAAPSSCETEDEQKGWSKIVKPVSRSAQAKAKAAATAAQAKKEADEEANADLPSKEDMGGLGEYIKTYLVGQAAIPINGKPSFIKVTYEPRARGRMLMRLSRGNPDRVTELVHRISIRTLAKGTTVFEVLRGEKGDAVVESKALDTMAMYREKTPELYAFLKHIWETYYPLSKPTAYKK